MKADLDSLRPDVERAAGEKLTPARWNALKAYAREHGLTVGALGREALVDALKEAAPAVGSGVGYVYRTRGHMPPPGKPYATPQRLLSETEKRRATALSTWSAGFAREHEPVKGFRADYLGGKILGEGEVFSFLSSFANRVLAAETVKRLGIPPRGASSVEVPLEHSYEWFTGQSGDRFLLRRLRVRCEWRRGRRTQRHEEIRYVQQRPERASFPWTTKSLELPGGTMELEYLAGSVIDDLLRKADWLVFELGWKEPDALWFILTGKAPIVPAIHTHIHHSAGTGRSRVRIQLEVEPWVSAASVQRVFAHSRRFVLGRRVRAIGLPALDRFDFVEAKRFARSKKPTWKTMAEDWSRRPGATRRARAKAWKRFQRDAVRTRRLLLRPTFAMGQDVARLEKEAALMRSLARLPLWETGPRQERLLARLDALKGRTRPARKRRTASRG